MNKMLRVTKVSVIERYVTESEGRKKRQMKYWRLSFKEAATHLSDIITLSAGTFASPGIMIILLIRPVIVEALI